MLSNFIPFRIRTAVGILLIGVCAAFVRERGPDWEFWVNSGVEDGVIALSLGPTPPEPSFLQEDDVPDDDISGRGARKAGLAPAPDAPGAPLSAADLSRRLGVDVTGLAEAIAAYKSGDLGRGDAAAKVATNETVKTALEWIALRTFPREAGFARIQAFASEHPEWPAQTWLRKRSEEALFGDRKNASRIKPFFSGARPETPAGKLALARVLTDEGKTEDAAALVREVWRESDLNATLETKIKTDFMSYLGRADHKYRADRLLYKEQTANAMRAAALAGPDVVALAKARAAVIAEASSDKLLAAVPAPLRGDPGFLFAQIQKLRRADKIREAVDVMLSAPRDLALLVSGDEWWVERRMLARKMLDQNDPATAYKLCAEHSATSREMKIEAEFHAGWIALRFQNDPARATNHFAALAQFAETPMSRARAAYWQGRAAEASAAEGAAERARSFYEKAAHQPTTYYGQLAREKLGLETAPIRSLPSEAIGEAREDSIRVVELLYGLGEKSLATPLAVEAVHHLTDETQIAALANVIASQRDAQISLMVGKLASYRGLPLDTLAFPTYGVPAFQPLQKSAGPSLVYAIARQESAFNPGAVSTAGAKGLMQMISSTARRTAQRAGVPFDENRLVADAAFNAQLAAAHIGELLTEQRGSYILTFAAYNAGGKRVKQWIDAYGDPRKPGVDPVDWVERIPFSETRNYVQRVSENLGIYRIRFGEDQPQSEEVFAKAQAKL